MMDILCHASRKSCKNDFQWLWKIDHIVISACLFMLISNLVGNYKVNALIIKISNATLIAYLISKICDIQLFNMGFFEYKNIIAGMLIYVMAVSIFSIGISSLCSRIIFDSK